MIAADPCTIYLPIVIKSDRLDLGVQIEGSTPTADLVPFTAPVHLKAYWDECEQTPGEYTWPAKLCGQVEVFRNNGNRIIIGTRTTPPFYWSDPAHQSPPRIEYYSAYADFLVALVDRFNPWGIEIYNEPSAEWVPETERLIGCWGPVGGAEYGTLVAYVSQRLKAERPAVKILAGALNGEALLFAQDFLNSAGHLYDYVSFHWYYHSSAQYANLFNTATDLTWITSKPLVCTETSYLYDERTPEQDTNQAIYLRSIIETGNQSFWLDRMPMILWYTHSGNGWRHSDLIEDGDKKQVFQVWYNYLRPTI